MRIRIRLSFVIYILGIAFLSSIQRCLAVLTALIIHELGHYAACTIFGERIIQLELTPFGGVMTFAAGKPQHKGARGCIVALSGPFANYLLILLVSSNLFAQTLPEYIVKELILANLSMIMLNLLPVLPLDGGQTVFAAGYYFFKVSKLIVFLSTAGIIVGTAIAALSVYSFIALNTTLNCSLLLIGIYIVYSAVHTRKNLMAENVFAIMHEQSATPQPAVNRLRLFLVREDTPLLSLVEYLSHGQSVLFLVDQGESTKFLHASDVCMLLLKSPGLTIQEALPDTNSRVFINKSIFYS